MTAGDARFEVFRDPTDSWVVWDCERDNFASLGANALYGLAESYARRMCHFLNTTRDAHRRASRPWLRPVPSSR
ncbi:unnamed protein product [marine sediment metagenome]|uniref:Uncharacterized protein n=1 Tax=marine sediment metagenome TaxID=412755 RepID=X1GRB7_9ZZZZ